MAEFFVVQPQVIFLRWWPTSKVFEFRLKRGDQWVTPQLKMTPWHWHLLLTNRFVILERPGEHYSVRLVKDGADLRIEIFAQRYYKDKKIRDLTEVHEEWPKVPFNLIYYMARDERGELPEKDWEKVVEAEMEAERDSWNSA